MPAGLLRRTPPHNGSEFKVVGENLMDQSVAGNVLEISAIGKETKKRKDDKTKDLASGLVI
jgi:hypothetical protein